MSRDLLIARLLDLPKDLAATEREVLTAQRILSAAKEDLADREGALLLGDEITGKNAEQRQAQLRALTTAWRLPVQQAEEELKLAAVRLHALQAEHASLRAAARLLAGDNHD